MSAWEEDEAIVLRHTPYGESSMVLSVFSHQHGRLQLLHRSAMKGSRRGESVPDRLRHMYVRYRVGRSDLHTLESSELIADYQQLARDTRAFRLVTWFAAFLLRNSQPEAPLPHTFEALLCGFRRLAQGDRNLRAIAVAFGFTYLSDSGLLPDFDEATNGRIAHVLAIGATVDEAWPAYDDEAWQVLLTWVISFLQRCDLHVPESLNATVNP